MVWLGKAKKKEGKEKTLGNKEKKNVFAKIDGRPDAQNVKEQMSQPRTGYVRVISKRESIPQRPPAALLCPARYLQDYQPLVALTTSEPHPGLLINHP